MRRVFLARGDLLAGQLAGGNRIMPLDARGDLAVSDALHFEGMQFTEIGDLIEAERSVLDEPYGSRLGHERGVGHSSLLWVSAALERYRGLGGETGLMGACILRCGGTNLSAAINTAPKVRIWGIGSFLSDPAAQSNASH